MIRKPSFQIGTSEHVSQIFQMIQEPATKFWYEWNDLQYVLWSLNLNQIIRNP